jgi:hypothetical protein
MPLPTCQHSSPGAAATEKKRPARSQASLMFDSFRIRRCEARLPRQPALSEPAQTDVSNGASPQAVTG